MRQFIRYPHSEGVLLDIHITDHDDECMSNNKSVRNNLVWV